MLNFTFFSFFSGKYNVTTHIVSSFVQFFFTKFRQISIKLVHTTCRLLSLTIPTNPLLTRSRHRFRSEFTRARYYAAELFVCPAAKNRPSYRSSQPLPGANKWPINKSPPNHRDATAIGHWRTSLMRYHKSVITRNILR